MTAIALVSIGACSAPSPEPAIPLLEPGLWTFEIETRREGQPVEKRTIRDCVGLRGLYSADRPSDCARIDANRSADGKTLTVETECSMPARKVSTRHVGQAYGRGPLDFEVLTTTVKSRSVFSGDLRTGFVRDNVTTLESPPGDLQVTRRITRASWQAAACPADLPPDDMTRWIADRSDAAAANPNDRTVVSGSAPQSERTARPQMRAGRWLIRVATQTDGGARRVETHQQCAVSGRDEALDIPEMISSQDVCSRERQVEVVETPSGFVMTTRCANPSRRLMASDIDIETPRLDILSRSQFDGDFARRFTVRHVTEAAYATGRREQVDSTIEASWLGRCERETKEDREGWASLRSRITGLVTGESYADLPRVRPGLWATVSDSTVIDPQSPIALPKTPPTCIADADVLREMLTRPVLDPPLLRSSAVHAVMPPGGGYALHSGFAGSTASAVSSPWLNKTPSSVGSLMVRFNHEWRGDFVSRFEQRVSASSGVIQADGSWKGVSSRGMSVLQRVGDCPPGTPPGRIRPAPAP